MSAVPLREVVEALRFLAGQAQLKEVMVGAIEMSKRIEQHGIAPPDGWVLVPVDPTDAMQTAHDMYGDTSDWWNAVISAVIRAAAPEVKP